MPATMHRLLTLCYRHFFDRSLFIQGKVNSARYTAQAINPMLLPVLRQEGDVLFQQANARLHTAVVTQLALRCVQKPP